LQGYLHKHYFDDEIPPTTHLSTTAKMEWTKEQYNKQYEAWVPWVEDLYLRYFTKDNKASYSTRGMSRNLTPSPPRPQFYLLPFLPLSQPPTNNHPLPSQKTSTKQK